MDIKAILREIIKADASDLLVKEGYPPYMRHMGSIMPMSFPVVTKEDIDTLIKEVLTHEQLEYFNSAKEIDYILDYPDIGRFRANISLDRQNFSLVCRVIKTKIPSFADLNLPEKILQTLCMHSRGLILMTGSIGSGKSTTIASMIEHINQHRKKHILTIEEPIEIIFEYKLSVISQREIGFDTISYAHALRHSVYQSPDIIFIGTIRDSQTMATALSAAETGQLVLSTMHSINAPQTIERIVNFFPEHQHKEIRMQLSLLLKGIISLRLVPRADGKGRIPVPEVMVWTPTISSLIREGKTNELAKHIEKGSFFGMQSFHQTLTRFYIDKKITLETAREFADNPEELDLFITGIKKLDGRIE